MWSFLKVGTFCIYPIVLVYLLEHFVRKDLSQTEHVAYIIPLDVWIIEAGLKLYIAILILLIVQCIILLICRNIYITLILNTIIIYVFYSINKYKMIFLGDPFLPWDLLLVGQFIDLLPSFSKEFNLTSMSLVIIIAGFLVIFLAKKTTFIKINLVFRITGVALFVFLLFLLGNYNSNFLGDIYKKKNIFSVPENQINHHNINGFLFGFFLNIPISIIDKPKNYNYEEVQKTISEINGEFSRELKGPTENIEKKNLEIKPNVVVVMSEALWDLGKLKLEKDVETYIPNIYEDQIGHFLSPQYGGGTANVEFEVLTSFSTNFLPKGSIAYMQYINTETPSLASYYKKLGYNTTAIHTFTKSFWKREEVYPLLGFEKFKGAEDFDNPKVKGDFIADAEITNSIIEELNSNDKPSFIYAITMQNHGGYENGKYGDLELTLNTDLDAKFNNLVNTYYTGITDADLEYKKLKDYLTDFNEPTILIVFGDHLPGLSKLYLETGFIKDELKWDDEDQFKMKQTPLAVWNNYDYTVQSKELISANLLGSNILEWSQQPLSYYYTFIKEFQTEFTGYTTDLKIDNRLLLNRKYNGKQAELVDIYKLVQYDMLFGDRLLMKEGFFGYKNSEKK